MQVTPRSVTEQELWTALHKEGYSLAGMDIEAVGNDAECFLMEWTSDSPDNVVGYANSAYDTLMAIIAQRPPTVRPAWAVSMTPRICFCQTMPWHRCTPRERPGTCGTHSPASAGMPGAGSASRV